MNINYFLIGQRVSSRRKQLNLTQAELAEKAELTPKYISKIETSKNPSLTIKSILQLCGALDATPNFLMLGLRDGDEKADYIEAAEKLKLCSPKQLRQASKHIDVILSE